MRQLGAKIQIRGVVSDLDGVVYRGEAPILASVEAFRRWRERGVPYAFVTNNSSKSAAQFAAKLSRLGVAVTEAQIFTAIGAAAALLKQRWPQGGRAFVVGERALCAAVEEAGFVLTHANPEVVVLGFDHELTYEKLRIATRAALAGATVVATNPDALTPTPDGYDPCVGVLIAAISAAVPPVEMIVVGKPQSSRRSRRSACRSRKRSWLATSSRRTSQRAGARVCGRFCSPATRPSTLAL